MGMQPGRALGQSGAEIIKARSYGLQPFVPLTDGTVYMPFGGGLSSCGLNARVVRQTDDLLERARTLQLHYQQNADQLCAELEALTGRRLEQLHLKVILIGADRDLLVVESQLNMGLLRPGQQPPAASYRLVGSPPVGNERAL